MKPADPANSGAKDLIISPLQCTPLPRRCPSTKASGLKTLEIEIVEEQGVRVAKLDIGNTHIELLEPLSADTPVGKFLAQKGPGLHHICIGVENIEADLEELKSSGTKLINETAKIGAGRENCLRSPKGNWRCAIRTFTAKPSLVSVRISRP